jgi:hypothetical protein
VVKQVASKMRATPPAPPPLGVRLPMLHHHITAQGRALTCCMPFPVLRWPHISERVSALPIRTSVDATAGSYVRNRTCGRVADRSKVRKLAWARLSMGRRWRRSAQRARSDGTPRLRVRRGKAVIFTCSRGGSRDPPGLLMKSRRQAPRPTG